jgi:hypothetical protein
VRVLAFAAAIIALANAPLQCASDPEPGLRRYETPGEALYGLAQQFKAKGDEAAWRTTLSYLIAKYPNSRFAAMAKTDLGEDSEDGEGASREGKGASR